MCVCDRLTSFLSLIFQHTLLQQFAFNFIFIFKQFICLSSVQQVTMQFLSNKQSSLVLLFLCCSASIAELEFASPSSESNAAVTLQVQPFEPFVPFVPISGPLRDICSKKLEQLKQNFEKQLAFTALGLNFYSYDIQSTCLVCGFETVGISVCGDKQSEVSESFTQVSNVMKLFEFVSDAIMRADIVEVEYDAELHFPTKIYANFLAGALDNGQTYQISNFQVLSEDTCSI
eukprot:TRINITY_DN258_c0_g1_i1.p1 TRINITY_DN258_c0_g1~~TRINITY_DN258_c0_g1_i1.p1  ORF type:complete len:231 (-),score=22.72 TRINITY_DN258_c0_g1_i1:312-1004(-)